MKNQVNKRYCGYLSEDGTVHFEPFNSIHQMTVWLSKRRVVAVEGPIIAKDDDEALKKLKQSFVNLMP